MNDLDIFSITNNEYNHIFMKEIIQKQLYLKKKTKNKFLNIPFVMGYEISLGKK